MGILITVVILTAVFIVLTVALDKYEVAQILTGACSVATGMVAIALFIIILINVATTTRELNSLQIQSQQYQEIVDCIQLDAQSSGNVYGEIVEFNQRVLSERDKSDSFWLKGLHLSIWKEVPLVDLHLTD